MVFGTSTTFLRNAVLVATTIALASTSTTFVKNVNAAYDDPEITRDNWLEVTKGKIIFLKFFAPWCDHCKQIAPIWKKLEKKYKNHDKIAILEVDCMQKKGDLLCEDFGVEGFPELVWGDSAYTQKYKGKKDFESMSAFIEENLTKPYCSVMTIDACPENEQSDMAAIDELTKEYFAKLFAFKNNNNKNIERPEDIANQSMMKNGIRNPFIENLDDWSDDDDDADIDAEL